MKNKYLWCIMCWGRLRDQVRGQLKMPGIKLGGTKNLKKNCISLQLDFEQ